MSKTLITEVIPIKKPINSPILLNFENGEMLPSIAKSMNCKLGIDSKDSSYPLVALAATKETIYTGHVGKDYPQDLMGTWLGIRNTTNNKMRIIEVSHCSMISHHYTKSPSWKKFDSSMQDITDARKTFAREYGSKKDRVLLERKERMQVNVDIVKEQLDKTVVDFTENMDTKESSNVIDDFDLRRQQQEENQKTMLPPINPNATKIDEIYTINQLIDQSLLDRLDEEALEILKTAPQHMPFEPNYLLDIVLSIQQSKEPDSVENLQKVKICIYIDALINFLTELKEKRRNKDMKNRTFSKITEKVESNIRAKFVMPNSIKLVKTNYTLNKAISYIIILSLLIADKNMLNFDRLIEATNETKSRVHDLTYALPIRHKRESNEICLKLPSQITERKKFMRRKR